MLKLPVMLARMLAKLCVAVPLPPEAAERLPSGRIECDLPRAFELWAIASLSCVLLAAVEELSGLIIGLSRAARI